MGTGGEARGAGEGEGAGGGGEERHGPQTSGYWVATMSRAACVLSPCICDAKKMRNLQLTPSASKFATASQLAGMVGKYPSMLAQMHSACEIAVRAAAPAW